MIIFIEVPIVMDRLLGNERAKVLAVVLIVAVGTAVVAKNAISYPTECMTEEMVNLYEPTAKRT